MPHALGQVKRKPNKSSLVENHSEGNEISDSQHSPVLNGPSFDVDDDCIDENTYFRALGLLPANGPSSPVSIKLLCPTELHILNYASQEKSTRVNLCGVDFTSSMGQLMTQNFQNSSTFDIDQLISRYERHCNTELLSQKLQLRDRATITFPVTFRCKEKKNHKDHQYCFNRSQREERIKTLLTGLNRRSRYLKRLCRPCVVKVERLKYTPRRVNSDLYKDCSVLLHRLSVDLPEASHTEQPLDAGANLIHQDKENLHAGDSLFLSTTGREIQLDGMIVIDLCSDEDEDDGVTVSPKYPMCTISPAKTPSDKNFEASWNHDFLYNIPLETAEAKSIATHSMSDAQRNCYDGYNCDLLGDQNVPNADGEFYGACTAESAVENSPNTSRIVTYHSECNVVLEKIEGLLRPSDNGMLCVKGTGIKVPQSTFSSVLHSSLSGCSPANFNGICQVDAAANQRRNSAYGYEMPGKYQGDSLARHSLPNAATNGRVNNSQPKLRRRTTQIFQLCDSQYGHATNPATPWSQNVNHLYSNSSGATNNSCISQNQIFMARSATHSPEHKRISGHGQRPHSQPRKGNRLEPFKTHQINGTNKSGACNGTIGFQNTLSSSASKVHFADLRKRASPAKCTANKPPAVLTSSTNVSIHSHRPKQKHLKHHSRYNSFENASEQDGYHSLSLDNVDHNSRTCLSTSNGNTSLHNIGERVQQNAFEKGDKLFGCLPVIFMCSTCDIMQTLHQDFQTVIAQHIIFVHGGFHNVKIFKQYLKIPGCTLIELTAK